MVYLNPVVVSLIALSPTTTKIETATSIDTATQTTTQDLETAHVLSPRLYVGNGGGKATNGNPQAPEVENVQRPKPNRAIHRHEETVVIPIIQLATPSNTDGPLNPLDIRETHAPIAVQHREFVYPSPATPEPVYLSAAYTWGPVHPSPATPSWEPIDPSRDMYPREANVHSSETIGTDNDKTTAIAEILPSLNTVMDDAEPYTTPAAERDIEVRPTGTNTGNIFTFSESPYPHKRADNTVDYQTSLPDSGTRGLFK